MLILVLFCLPLAFSGCPTGAIYDQNFQRFYKYVAEPSAFYLAEEKCHSWGGDLVSITNGFENAMLSEAAEDHFDNANNFWIGASQLSNPNWSWINGNSLSYTNWAPDQPKNASGQCAFSSTTNGMWTATECSDSAPFICVFPFENTTCPAPPPPRMKCQSTWTYFAETDSCYKVGHLKNYDDAESDCMGNGAHLTSIHSAAENQFVNTLAAMFQIVPHTGEFHAPMTWIGLKKSYATKQWYWTDGSKLDYTNWRPTQPDNYNGVENCGQTITDYIDYPSTVPPYHQTWNDLICTIVMRAYVCKKPALH